MMTKLCSMRFKEWDCDLMLCHYGNDRLALQLLDAKDHTPVARATVNVPSAELADDEVVIKTYSENEGMLEALLATGEFTAVPWTANLGTNVHDQPIVRINRLSVMIGRCPTCATLGFDKSVLPGQCEFCDGTHGGNPPDYWSGDPHHALEDWQYEVANNDTRSGYHEWVLNKTEQEADELCQSQTS